MPSLKRAFRLMGAYQPSDATTRRCNAGSRAKPEKLQLMFDRTAVLPIKVIYV
jgi:hypothetical protein